MSVHDAKDADQLCPEQQDKLPPRFSCFLIGTESHLVQCAQILLERGHQICGIVSAETRIAEWAKEKGIPLIEPGADLAGVMSQQPFDYLLSITNLSILPDDILSLPRQGAINFCDGPLPRYAGFNATSWALIHQEKSYGVTWHLMNGGVEEGDILKQRPIDIAEDDTAFTLNAKCYEAAIDSFAELVDELDSGRVERRAQDLGERTYFSRYQRPPAACTLSWKRSAPELDALVRALDLGRHANPLGLPKVLTGKQVLVVTGLDVLEQSQVAPGTITAIDDDAIHVATASHDVALRKLLTLDGQPLPAGEIVERCGVHVGERLAELDPESAERLGEIDRALGRHETFWVERLARRQTIELPYANHSVVPDGPAQYAAVPMTLPDGPHTAARRGEWMAAAFAAYLARVTNHSAFDLGFSHPALRHQVGGFERFFSTHVPWRVEIDPSGTLQAALDALQAQLALAGKHKTYARDAILRHPKLGALRGQGDRSPWPIVVEVVECLDDYKPLPGSELTLLLSKEGKECRWVHDTAVLDGDSIASMQRQFATFVQHAVDGAPGPFVESPLLNEAERHQLMVEWNNTQVEYRKDLSIHQWIEAQVERTPDAVAVIFEDRQLTYRQLNGRANQLAHHLRKLGVGPETRVGLYVDRSPDMMVGLLGILKAGGAYLPLDHTYPAERTAFAIQDARVPVLVTEARFEQDLSAHPARLVRMDADWDTISAESEENLRSEVTWTKRPLDNLAYLMYTSGSTGKPKGVMVCHGNVVNFFTGMDAVIPRTFRPQTLRPGTGHPGTGRPHDPPGVWLAVTSLSFDISVLEVLWTLSRGFKVVVYADKTREEAGAEDYSIPALIERHHVTHLQCTPSMASMLLIDDRTRAALESVQTLMVGGEALPVALAAQLKQIVRGRVLNMYGPTETTVWSCTYAVDGQQNTVPIGRPIANTEIYIVDHNLKPVPVGVAGELLIGGDGVARGYLNRLELTAERFIQHPFSDRPKARLYRTGDLARYRQDGNIEFLGRSDHQVKIRGHRIELGEIEALLVEHPVVREAVVLAREDTPGDKRLVAYIIPNQRQQLSSIELRDYMKQKLPEFMVPSNFVALDAFPQTPNLKIDRKALPAPDQAQLESGQAYVAPENELQAKIVTMWQELLHVQVGINDNFFDLGGHSILVVRAHARLCRELDRKLSITELFRFPTIRELARYLSQDGDNGHAVSGQESTERANARREAMIRRRQQRQKVRGIAIDEGR